MAHSPPYILIGLASVLTFVQHCLSGGSIQVTLIEYEPRKWKQKNEEECGEKMCGIFFHIKFFEEGLDGRWRSDVWPMITTDTFQMRNSDGILVFGKRLSSLQPNPMRRNFTSGMFGLRIFIMETGAQQPIEEFNSIFSITEFPPTEERDHTFYSEKYPYSIFTMRVLFLCHDFYLGPKCLIYCQPQDNEMHGHYNCSETGKKFCLPGWLNVTSNCVVKDFCSSSPCQNNASCSQTPSNFSCACKERFAGRFCEKKLTACDLLNPCLNGATCISDGPDKRHCECPSGYLGSNCSRDHNECLEEPCNNGGQCQNLEGSFECDCYGTGFEGKVCEKKMHCLEGPCQNNGTCEREEIGTRCLCPPPYFGEDCSKCNSSLGQCPCRGPLCRLQDSGRPVWSVPEPSHDGDLYFWLTIAAICGTVCGAFLGPVAFYVLQRKKGWLRLSSSRKLYTPDLEVNGPTADPTEPFLSSNGGPATFEASHTGLACRLLECEDSNGASTAVETKC